jgi:hypothetical protein
LNYDASGGIVAITKALLNPGHKAVPDEPAHVKAIDQHVSGKYGFPYNSAATAATAA